MVPPGMRVRSRWPLRAIVILMILVSGGLYRLWSRSSSSVIGPGFDAYAHGDWDTALKMARERLKHDPNDIPGLQLLARSSVRLGLDSSALSLYQRLGAESMTADDCHLLGVAMRRTGDQRGVSVWEQALRVHPDHPETLDALSQVYFEGTRHGDAARLRGAWHSSPSGGDRASGCWARSSLPGITSTQRSIPGSSRSMRNRRKKARAPRRETSPAKIWLGLCFERGSLPQPVAGFSSYWPKHLMQRHHGS